MSREGLALVRSTLLGTHSIAGIGLELEGHATTLNVYHSKLEHAKLGSIPDLVAKLSIAVDIGYVEQLVATCHRIVSPNSVITSSQARHIPPVMLLHNPNRNASVPH